MRPEEAELHATPELVTLLQRERERHIAQDHLARIAACHHACRAATTSFVERVMQALRPEPAGC